MHVAHQSTFDYPIKLTPLQIMVDQFNAPKLNHIFYQVVYTNPSMFFPCLQSEHNKQCLNFSSRHISNKTDKNRKIKQKHGNIIYEQFRCIKCLGIKFVHVGCLKKGRFIDFLFIPKYNDYW